MLSKSTDERLSIVRAEWRCSPEGRRRGVGREFEERVAGRSAVHRLLAAVCDLDARAAHRVCAVLRGVQRGLPQVAAPQAVPAHAMRERRDAAAREQ